MRLLGSGGALGRRGCRRRESVLRACAQGEHERELRKSTHRGPSWSREGRNELSRSPAH
ncbi:Hypothetical protein A7982_07938 [Minicystis rosea]|nr:Hypothetical protein A7982_07938 [Minicystis rosea]